MPSFFQQKGRSPALDYAGVTPVCGQPCVAGPVWPALCVPRVWPALCGQPCVAWQQGCPAWPAVWPALLLLLDGEDIDDFLQNICKPEGYAWYEGYGVMRFMRVIRFIRAP